MTGLWLIWAKLALCGGAIAVAGTLLTRYADVIADKTGWSGAWTGLVLLATVTSLPKLATGIDNGSAGAGFSGAARNLWREIHD